MDGGLLTRLWSGHARLTVPFFEHGRSGRAGRRTVQASRPDEPMHVGTLGHAGMLACGQADTLEVVDIGPRNADLQLHLQLHFAVAPPQDPKGGGPVHTDVCMAARQVWLTCGRGWRAGLGALTGGRRARSEQPRPMAVRPAPLRPRRLIGGLSEYPVQLIYQVQPSLASAHGEASAAPTAIFQPWTAVCLHSIELFITCLSM